MPAIFCSFSEEELKNISARKDCKNCKNAPMWQDQQLNKIKQSLEDNMEQGRRQSEIYVCKHKTVIEDTAHVEIWFQ